jgi:hypothetical protein
LHQHISMRDERGAENPVPPDPPPMDRKVRIDRVQLVSIPIMVLVALLALSGLLGESTSESRSAEGGPLAVRVSYPSRLRFHQQEALEIAVHNVGPGPLEPVAVEIDRTYLEAFSVSTIIPDADRVTSDAYVIQLGRLLPGQVRRVTMQVEAEHPGHHRGLVVARSGAVELGRAEVDTYLFP